MCDGNYNTSNIGENYENKTNRRKQKNWSRFNFDKLMRYGRNF